MKKRVFFIAALAAAVFTSNDLAAQDGGMKPAGGEKNIEVNFTPLGGKPIGINNLRFRYFKSADMAFRIGLNVASSSETTKKLGANADGKGEMEDVSSSFGFGLNLGVEKHFAGTDRLSPYVGAELGFAMASSSETTQAWNGTKTVEGEVTDGSTTFGLNLLLGADYYFSSHIYMGTEVGFGFSMTSQSDTETTKGGSVPDDTAEKATAPGGSSFNLGPNFNSAIRLGYLF